MVAEVVLYLLVGLPASGKTTRAREIEQTRNALRFTPDEWMIPLYGESDPGGRRDVLEGRLIWVALRALQAGISAVLDFGFWGRDEPYSVGAASAWCCL
jgi:predicted kinase